MDMSNGSNLVQHTTALTSTKDMIIRDLAIKWIMSHNFERPYAATYTLKKYIHLESPLVKGDRFRHQANFRYFCNVQNDLCYGKNSKEKIALFPTYEIGASADLPHYHVLGERPSHIPFPDFARQSTELWENTHWGRHQTDFQEVYDMRGWLIYQLKLKPHPATCLDAVDYLNCTLKMPVNAQTAVQGDQ